MTVVNLAEYAANRGMGTGEPHTPFPYDFWQPIQTENKSMATVLNGRGRFPGMPATSPSFEHIQTGANTVARRLGEVVTISGILESEYFMHPDDGSEEEGSYLAGGVGIRDFSRNIKAVMDKLQPDTPVIAQTMYGAYAMGRLLMPRIVAAYRPLQLDKFRDKVKCHMSLYGHTTLDVATEAVSNRAAARFALTAVNDLLREPAREALDAALLGRQFSRTNREVARDFLQPLE